MRLSITGGAHPHGAPLQDRVAVEMASEPHVDVARDEFDAVLEAVDDTDGATGGANAVMERVPHELGQVGAALASAPSMREAALRERVEQTHGLKGVVVTLGEWLASRVE